MPKRTFGAESDREAICGPVKRRNTDCADAQIPTLVGVYPEAMGNDEYTVGWICALSTEYVAAQAFLDETHKGPRFVSPYDHNHYTLGRMGNHHIVIAVLPSGEYGIASAAIVAKDMLHSFPNIKVGLMVGIGGGAPSQKHDIRLGDVVVSDPRDGIGGVFQYDFGKILQDQVQDVEFCTTGFLNQPPIVLRTAVSGIKAHHEMHGHRLKEAINNTLEKIPRLQQEYKRPDPCSDRLYRCEFTHPVSGGLSCTAVCGNDPSKLISRPERTRDGDTPNIHYGLIASANQLMKNAQVRDRLALKKNILCFEMEAAGLMSSFPCLIIRGICDYSDSHKNEEWQGYAAMAAAAYAKDLLSQIPQNSVENLRRTSSGISLQPRRGENQSLNDEQRRVLLESLRFDQIDARQMTIKNAHAKTCKWLLKTPAYLDWLDPNKFNEHFGFLWIKGKPGAGKSTLMKFALANARKKTKDKIIISFFFNARGSDLEKSTIGLYRSMLLQLLDRLPGLQEVFDSLPLAIRDSGYDQWRVELLKALFEKAVQGLGETSLVCFIDALDECDEDQIRDMISFFESLIITTTSAGINFRVCFSSRHYPHISIKKGLDLILEGHEGHRQDIVNYVDSELTIGHSRLAAQIRADLQEKASGVFMWVVLVVGILNKAHDKGRIHELRKILRDIPGDLHELFRDILTRDCHKRDELLLCIQWVLFSRQPLKPEQLYFAILSGIEPGALSDWNHDEITVSIMKNFILDSSKGLTEVTKSKNPTIQFIHESVKDFLLKENGLREIWSDFGENFQGESHERLKQCCLRYMSLDIAAHLNIGSSLPKASSQEAAELRQSADTSFPLLEYAVRNVLYHADAAEGGGTAQTSLLQTFPQADWIKLDNLFERHEVRRHTNASLLYILAEHNMANLIRRHPSNLSGFEVQDERYGAPIFAALATNSGAATRALLKAQVEINPAMSPLCSRFGQYCPDGKKKPYLGRDFIFSRGRNVLTYLAEHGEEVMILAFLLAERDADIDIRDRDRRTPLSWAATNGHEAVVKLLLEKGANTETTESHYGQTPLLWAAKNGHKAVVKLLLEKGANTETIESYYGQTPLLRAAKNGHEAVVKLLLEKGANTETIESFSGQTPLLWAAENGHEAVVKLLLEKGADTEAINNRGQTPLLWAAENGHEAVVKLLLEKGANIKAMDNRHGRTPLFAAVQNGHEAMVRLLLEKGADTEAKDWGGKTQLSRAVMCGNESVAKLLLEQGANIETKDEK
ncbi:Ankyrin repeat domain-containing protein 50 [Metarhizium anisopliae]|nr:Ankyrin repeat domain-containing protein 50 [Metarhizium anisopliae]